MPLTPEQEALKAAAQRAKGAGSTVTHHYRMFQDTATPELILALFAQLEAQEAPEDAPELALNTMHKLCHQAADAFWTYWNENGETHKHGYYESTWGAINRAIRMVGVVPHKYNSPAPDLGVPAQTGAAQTDKLLAIIASAYQIAGWHDAPEHILDVLADPEAATAEQVDAMLPYQPGSMLAAQSVPDGTQLVPKTPTPEMIRAGENSAGRSTMKNMESYSLIYRDMLAAAPVFAPGDPAQ